MQNYINYIISGLNVADDLAAFFKKTIFGPLVLSLLLGVAPCVILGYPWYIIAFFMISTSIMAIFLTLILAKSKLTILKRLILQTVLYADWVAILYSCNLVYMAMLFGFNFSFFICELMVLLLIISIPCIIGMKNAFFLKKGHTIPKVKTFSHILLPSGMMGVVGYYLAKAFLKDIGQQPAIYIVVISFVILACIFSMGLLSIQRLYYLNILIKKGVCIDALE